MIVCAPQNLVQILPLAVPQQLCLRRKGFWGMQFPVLRFVRLLGHLWETKGFQGRGGKFWKNLSACRFAVAGGSVVRVAVPVASTPLQEFQSKFCLSLRLLCQMLGAIPRIPRCVHPAVWPVCRLTLPSVSVVLIADMWIPSCSIRRSAVVGGSAVRLVAVPVASTPLPVVLPQFCLNQRTHSQMFVAV